MSKPISSCDYAHRSAHAVTGENLQSIVEIGAHCKRAIVKFALKSFSAARKMIFVMYFQNV